MLGRLGICLVVIGFIFLLLCCERIPTPSEPTIAIGKLADLDSIPSKWGNLVFVSNRPDIEHVFQLWFQDEDGNVRMAKYNDNIDQLLPKTILISRK